MCVEPGIGGAVTLSGLARETPAAATILIGPEGGWTPAEVEQARPSCTLLTLGGRTLRADAMSIVALAALYAQWGEF